MNVGDFIFFNGKYVEKTEKSREILKQNKPSLVAGTT